MTVAATAPTMGALIDAEPFEQPGFRADLAALGASVRQDWQRWAEQAELITRLAAQVPRSSRDDGAWKSFIREVAVARRCSDQAAAKEVFLAVALIRSHPRVLDLLQQGLLPLYNARVLVEETAGCDPAVVAAVDHELAEPACRLTPSRIRDAVRKIELRHDADAAAARSAKARTGRDVRLFPQRDDQATLVLTGPALPVVQFYDALTAEARARRAAGDPRGLDALRFDLAVELGTDAPAAEQNSTAPTDAPTDAAAETDVAAADPAPAGTTPAPADSAPAPAWLGDRRRLRPVQAHVHLPVTTSLGLSNEPGWLAGYGWVSAPQCREWMTTAELRQVCVAQDGFVVDTADRAIRPPPTPQGVRDALLTMVRNPGPITDKTFHVEPQHDPSPALAGFVHVRDLFCDGPTGTRVPASRCDDDHETRYPDGPTAAWNLKARARRTHLLKHRGWAPLRTATATLWFTPAGQIVEVPHHTGPPPDLHPDAELPDPDQLHQIDTEYLRAPEPGDLPPLHDPPPF